MQEARNLVMKAELLIQEQIHSTNYKRYGIDHNTPSNKGKTPLVMFNVVETTDVGVGKGRSTTMEGGKDIVSMLAKYDNPYARPLSIKYYRYGKVGHQ